MRRVISGICNKHGFHEGSYCSKCDIMGVGEVFYASKDKLYDFVDVHSTGKPIHFTSKRMWESHLKTLGKRQLSKEDLKTIGTPKEPPKSDYRNVVVEAWKERTKFVMDIKYGRRQLGKY